jgi:hypothetical protein
LRRRDRQPDQRLTDRLALRELGADPGGYRQPAHRLAHHGGQAGRDARRAAGRRSRGLDGQQRAGVLRIQMADGTTFDAGPGAVTALPSGHDAWVVGDEPVVVVDWWGASNYAKA